MADTERTARIAARCRYIAHDSEHGRWELVRCRPHPALARHVLEYQGYREDRGPPVRRREMPVGQIVMIIDFGPGWLIGDERSGERLERFSSFAGGLSDCYAISESLGGAHCIQVAFTPLGASRYFRMPMRHLANSVASLDDLMGSAAGRLAAALREAPDWPSRFALLEADLLGRIGPEEPDPALPAFVWDRIIRSQGVVAISRLAEDYGVSRKHLSLSFREAVGLAPSTVARLLRFRRAAAMISTAGEPHWSGIALDCGYFDQSHFNREFRRFSGYTPTEFRRQALGDGTGILDSQAG